MKPCKVCGRPIPEARLEAQPRAETCSRACANENRMGNARKRAKAQRGRAKAKRRQG